MSGCLSQNPASAIGVMKVCKPEAFKPTEDWAP